MVPKTDILKVASDLATQVVAAKASSHSPSVTPETLPEYTEAIYRKLIDLINEEN